MSIMKYKLPLILSCLLTPQIFFAEGRVEMLPFGDMEQWVVRIIKESGIIGGATRELYCLGKTDTIRQNAAYDYAHSGSPWSSSNSYAKVAGVEKAACTVRPEAREGGGTCCRMDVEMQQVKALGIVNVGVVAGGTLFTGSTNEPIRSTDEPDKNIQFGMPFTRRPVALIFDYKCNVSPEQTMTSTKGGGKPKTVNGHDCPKVMMLLQHRWEDADGQVHALRVGTAVELFETTVSTWQNAHRLQLNYGDISSKSFFRSYMGMRTNLYTMNSKGKMVQIIEEGWDADKQPTHAVITFSAGSQEAFVGHVGNTLWVDNVMLEY